MHVRTGKCQNAFFFKHSIGKNQNCELESVLIRKSQNIGKDYILESVTSQTWESSQLERGQGHTFQCLTELTDVVRFVRTQFFENYRQQRKRSSCCLLVFQRAH